MREKYLSGFLGVGLGSARMVVLFNRIGDNGRGISFGRKIKFSWV